MWSQVQEALNQSMSRVITGFANLLPGLVAIIVAFLISSLFAWLVSVLLRRFLKALTSTKPWPGGTFSGRAKLGRPEAPA